ncbi:hypothetical protein QFC20_002928 [Naganishia adeliensis]|uniref:Uncharacterized protein n=1 Tax=Naganishia adeliensis TaxID=92952 RepID=A0ACC2WF08_9TREE|nr:hypothetical protein QFC20_002928 [Naganishia adeliensis]
MSVRPAQKNDAPEMARILYEAMRTTRSFGAVWPAVYKDNWLDVQADYCQQHINEPHSVALVSTDEKRALSGMLYGRFVTEEIASAETTLVDYGIDTGVLGRLDDEPFQSLL